MINSAGNVKLYAKFGFAAVHRWKASIDLMLLCTNHRLAARIAVNSCKHVTVKFVKKI